MRVRSRTSCCVWRLSNLASDPTTDDRPIVDPGRTPGGITIHTEKDQGYDFPVRNVSEEILFAFPQGDSQHTPDPLLFGLHVPILRNRDSSRQPVCMHSLRDAPAAPKVPRPDRGSLRDAVGPQIRRVHHARFLWPLHLVHAIQGGYPAPCPPLYPAVPSPSAA
jgi:hypothetical protein